MSKQVSKNTIGLAGGEALAADLAHLPSAIVVVPFRLECDAVDEGLLQRLRPAAGTENVSDIHFAAIEETTSPLAVPTHNCIITAGAIPGRGAANILPSDQPSLNCVTSSTDFLGKSGTTASWAG